jgi:hypothetical protein
MYIGYLCVILVETMPCQNGAIRERIQTSLVLVEYTNDMGEST